MDLEIRGAFCASLRDITRSYAAATLQHSGGDFQKRFELRSDRRVPEIVAYGIDKPVIAIEMMSGGRAVAGLSKITVVPRRNEGGDHLPLAAGQGRRPSKQHFGEGAQRLGRFRAESQEAADAREPFGQWNMRHDRLARF